MSEGRYRERLASLDSVQDTERLRQQAEPVLREGRGRTRPGGPFDGADGSGSISVRVDDRARVVAVEIDRQWRERIEVSGFPQALFEAYTAAINDAFEAAAIASLAADHNRRPAAPPAPAAKPSPETDDRDWLQRVWDTLDRNRAELRRLSEIDTSIRTRDRTLTSPAGHLTFRLQGHALAGITGSVARIATADAQQLRHEALATFHAAQLAADH